MATGKHENIARYALHKGRFIFVSAFLLSFLFNLLRLTGPMFMLLIYNRVLTSRSEETLVSLFILVAVFLVVMGLFDYSRRRILARFAAQFQERVEKQIFNTTTKDKFFVRGKSKPASGLTELDGLRGFFHSSGLISIFDFVWTPMFLIVVFTLHWKLGLVTIGGLGLLLLLSLVKMIFSAGRSERARNASNQIGSLKEMMLISNDTIRSQEMSASFKERWVAARKSSRDQAIELMDWSAWFSISSRQIRMLLQYTVLAAGAYLVLKGELTVGAMFATTFLVVRVLLPVEQFFNQLPNIKKALGNWHALNKIVTAKTPPAYNEDLNNLEARLSLSNVSARSPMTNQPILRSVSITIAPGTVAEITGPSGSGKTIMAETLLGAWPKSGGTILVGGTNVSRLSSEQAGRLFGYVPEAPSFVNGTIEENISRLELSPNQDKIYAAARLAGIHDMIIALPQGYQTQIEAASVGFSNGQKHQLSLARALYHDPKILIIDEPDTTLRKSLDGTLKELLEAYKAAGKIVLVFSRTPLKLAVTNARRTLDAGRLKTVSSTSAAPNVTRIDEKKPAKKVSGLKGV